MESSAQGGSDLPKVTGWIRGPAGNTTPESWLLKSGLITTSPHPAPMYQNDNEEPEDSSRAEQSPALQSPGCPRWQFAVQVGGWACRSGLSTDCHCWNQENRSLMHIWGSSAFHPEPLGVFIRFFPRVSLPGGLDGSHDSCTLPTWVLPGLYPSWTWSMCSGLGCKIQRWRSERAHEGEIERGKERRQVALFKNLVRL